MADETMSVVKSVSLRLATFMDEERDCDNILDNKMRIEKLQLDLEWCRHILEHLALEKNRNSNLESIRSWISQIREFANEAGVILDKYGLLITRAERGEGCCTTFGRICCCDCQRKALGEISSRIDDLSSSVLKLASRMSFRGVRASPPNWIYTRSAELDSNSDDQVKEEENNTAIFEGDTESKLVEQLIDRDEKEKEEVAVIYGQPGSGKTTLAKTICRRNDIREHFDCFVWVPPNSGTRKVLEWIWLDLHGGDYFNQRKKIRGTALDKLKSMIKVALRLKKLLLVLDDIRDEGPSLGLLRAVSSLINSTNNSKMILVTSSDVVQRMAITNKDYYQPKVSDEESLKLLRKVVSQQNDHQIGADDLKTFEKDMIQMCKNNPLAIIVLGGILAHKNPKQEWKAFHQSNEKKISEESVLQDVMELSFLELPSHLKPYLLHMGNLPRHIQIPANKLYRIWIAEGLVRSPTPNKSPEEIAGEYLNELVKRGLVEVVSRGKTGKVKGFQVHDNMRWFCQKKATEMSCHIISSRDILNAANSKKFESKYAGKNDTKAEKSDTSTTTAKRKSDTTKKVGKSDTEDVAPLPIRRPPGFALAATLSTRVMHGLAILADDDRSEMKNLSFPDDIAKNCRHLQSLLFLANNSKGRLPRGWLRSIVGGSLELRVLHVEYVRISALPESIGRLVHLKYLSLRGTIVGHELPSSIGELSLLETLDLRVFPSGLEAGFLGIGTFGIISVRLPDVFYKLRKLRHLYLPEVYICGRFVRRLHFHGMKSLEILKNLNLRICKVKGLADLEGLKKFTWKVDDTEDSFEVGDKKILMALLNSPKVKSGNLKEKLVLKMGGEMVCSRYAAQFSDLPGYKESVEGLIILGSLTSSLNTTLVSTVLQNLTSLVLRLTEFENDPMSILGDLLKLKNLRLSYRSFTGERMTCQTGKFPELVFLKLDTLSELREWDVEQDSMPKLELVEIEFCGNLMIIPHGLTTRVKVRCLSPCIPWNNMDNVCPHSEDVGVDASASTHTGADAAATDNDNDAGPAIKNDDADDDDDGTA